MHQPVQQQQQHHHQHNHLHPSQQPQPQQQQSQSQQHQPAVYVPAVNATMAAPTERQAHDQFLEQNAWARPQQSAMLAHGTPNLTHTPDWVDQPTNRHIIRNLSGPGQRTGSPFATPVSGKRSSGIPNDGLDVSSSAFAAPGSNPRAASHGISTGSPLQVTKQRQPNGNGIGGGERELTGFRNISNISSTSTIDAPLSAEKVTQDADRASNHDSSGSRHLPSLASEASAPQQSFDTSQLHRHPSAAEGGLAKDVYANPNFRPAEGAFGTPTAALMSGRAPPPGGQA